MLATWSASTLSALFAGRNCAKRMPFSMHTMCMATIPGIMISGTGVLASVSLFVLLHIVTALILASLMVLISLTLIGLTGLSGLVRLTTVRLELSAAQGD